MDQKQKTRLAVLKKNNISFMKETLWKRNSLLQECFHALGNFQIVNHEIEIAQITEIANTAPRFKISCGELTILEEHDYYVVWDDMLTPIIKCRGKDIMLNWDDVLAAAFDICIVDLENKRAILVGR